MIAVILFVWFYIYAGLMFSMVSYSVGPFQNSHWLAQVIFWPILLIVQAVRAIKNSNFGWFVRYIIFKMKNPVV